MLAICFVMLAKDDSLRTTILKSIDLETKEKTIQGYFDLWKDSVPPGVAIVGAPVWMYQLHELKARTQEQLFDYSFTPDALWEMKERYPAELVVFELKCADKYEPLALAEVLHHAHFYQRRYKHVLPVIVAKYNGWLRRSVAYLREQGLRESALTLLEVDYLRDGDKNQFLWFDEPLAPLKPVKKLPEVFKFGRQYKYVLQSQNAQTWLVANDDELIRPMRPSGIKGEFGYVSEIYGRNREYLQWEGEAPFEGKREWKSEFKIVRF